MNRKYSGLLVIMKLVWVIAICAICVSVAEMVHGAQSKYRLPGNVVPLHYDVRLVYDMDPDTYFSFYGVVNIQIRVKKPTSKIVLHAEKFSIKNNGISVSNGKKLVRLLDVKLDDTVNLFTISVDSVLTAVEKYNLTIPFFGQVSTTDMYGVYVSYYDDMKTGAREYSISTQFQSIFARRAFPCFDEPIYKATFELTLGHNKEYLAISNMPIDKNFNSNPLLPHWPWDFVKRTFKKELADFAWVKFEKSVLMSTYLVAFVIGKFVYRESTELSKWKFRVWARSDVYDQTEYALSIGPKILKRYEEWFNISYPLPKLDMVAIPNFPECGMENWGLTIYGPSYLLFDNYSSLIEKEKIAMTIAHELAHQWFGNLVTMKWWSDLWMNEGFATYISALGVAAAEPKWKYAFEGYEMVDILQKDALETSQQVSMDIVDPMSVVGVFDSITHTKASVLIRMLTMILDYDMFKEAIHNYLLKYSYNNADQDDLWTQMLVVSNKYEVLPKDMSIKKVMDSWTQQPGFPLLTVTRDYSSNSFTVTQTRYYQKLQNSTDDSASWWIPLGVMSERHATRDSQPLYWLAPNEGKKWKEQKFQHASTNTQWLLINADMIAPCRVNYDDTNWMLLVKVLRSPQFIKIPTLGRVQLLSDAFELAWTNRLNYSVAFRMAGYLNQEVRMDPLLVGLRLLSKIYKLLQRTPNFGIFEKYMRKVTTNRYFKVGGLHPNYIKHDNLESLKVKILLVGWACDMELTHCVDNALGLLHSWMSIDNPDDNNPIPIDFRWTVYCTAVRRGGDDHWQFILERNRRYEDLGGKFTMLKSALFCTREAWRHSQMLEWSLNTNEFYHSHPQEFYGTLSNILQSPVGYFVGKEFIYTRLRGTYIELPPDFGKIFTILLQQFTTQTELDEFMEWHELNADYLSSASQGIEKGIEQARSNIEWTQNHMATIVQLLEAEVN